jgi:hypothetical protein
MNALTASLPAELALLNAPNVLLIAVLAWANADLAIGSLLAALNAPNALFNAVLAISNAD